MSDNTENKIKYFVNGKLEESFIPNADIVFLDLGCRKGELFSLDGKDKGSYFNCSKKKLIVREDLGSHVEYAYMPIAFSLNRINYSEAGVYLFEPNSEYESILIELSKKISKLCKFVCYVPFASWVEECDKIFGICDSGYGSTLLLDKANTEFESYVSVSCIDIVNFINNINGAKEIHIKMDIEGAEYDILPYMLSNWNRNISSLAVEFHRDFYPKRDFEFWYNYSHSIINLLKFGCNFNWWPGEW